MEFKYEKDDPTPKEPVAFIHQSGCLILKHGDEGSDYCQVVGGGNDNEEWWNIWLENATKVFYPGDELTIKF
jgi:hypothetical protein